MVEFDSVILQIGERYAQGLRSGRDDFDLLIDGCESDIRDPLRVHLTAVRERFSQELAETQLFDSDRKDTSYPETPSAPVRALRPGLLTNPSLRSLSSDAIAALSAKLETRAFQNGESLLRQGEVGSQMYILVSGRVDVYMEHAGERMEIDSCAKGDILGEMSLLTHAPCTANVTANGQVQTLVLTKQDFEALKVEYPEIEIALSQVVSDRLGSRATDALTGKWIHDYRLRRCINRGGMGVVYEAEDRQGKIVALKMLHHRFLRKQEIIDSFLREGRILSGLTHPHIVSVKDCFVAFNTRFLVMDYWDGDDVAAVLERHGPFSESTCRSILGQLAQALAQAHRHGVLHLDIKPANILLARDGRVALTDFGLCKLIGESEGEAAVVGTLPYMPPEQYSTGELTQAADWYALGCTAFEMLTGERLFHEVTYSGFRLAKLRSQPDASWPVCAAGDELLQIIRDTLHPDPRDRRLDLEQLATWSQPATELTSKL